MGKENEALSLVEKFALDVQEVERVDLIVGVLHGGQSTTSIRGADKSGKVLEGRVYWAPAQHCVIVDGKRGLLIIPLSNCRQVVVRSA